MSSSTPIPTAILLVDLQDDLLSSLPAPIQTSICTTAYAILTRARRLASLSSPLAPLVVHVHHEPEWHSDDPRVNKWRERGLAMDNSHMFMPPPALRMSSGLQETRIIASRATEATTASDLSSVLLRKRIERVLVLGIGPSSIAPSLTPIDVINVVLLGDAVVEETEGDVGAVAAALGWGVGKAEDRLRQWDEEITRLETQKGDSLREMDSVRVQLGGVALPSPQAITA